MRRILLTIFFIAASLYGQVTCDGVLVSCNSNPKNGTGISSVVPIPTSNLPMGTVYVNLPSLIGNLKLNSIAPPSAGPTVTPTGTGVLTGAYIYSIHFISVYGNNTGNTSHPTGETDAGVDSATANPSAQQVLVTPPIGANGLICPAGAVSWTVYRTTVGGVSTLKQWLTKQSCAVASFTDNVADGSLGRFEPAINTTGATFWNGVSVFAGQGATSTFFGNNGYGINQTGKWDTSFGAGTGAHITSALSNSLFGYNCGNGITTGNGNTCIGYTALQNVTTAGFNFAGGYQAQSTATGANNNCVGRACLTATSGSNNTGFGDQACSNVTSGSNNTCLGAVSQVSSPTASHQFVLGTASDTVIIPGGFVGSGSVPIITGCGTSPTLATSSTNLSGNVIEGSGASGCTITWATPFVSTPTSSNVDSTNGSITYTFSTTAIVVTDVLATAGTVISWIQTGK